MLPGMFASKKMKEKTLTLNTWEGKMGFHNQSEQGSFFICLYFDAR